MISEACACWTEYRVPSLPLFPLFRLLSLHIPSVMLCQRVWMHQGDRQQKKTVYPVQRLSRFFTLKKKKSLISWLVIVSVPAAGNFRACTRELAPRLGQSFSLPVNSIANLIQLLVLVILRVELPLNSLNVGSFRRTEAQNKRTGIG